MRIFLTLLFIATTSFLHAQSWAVYFIDQETKESVAFVSVHDETGKYLGSADVDGKIMVKTQYQGARITVKSIGYKNQTFVLTSDKQKISLIPDSKELAEVEIFPGENPAHRIIRNAIDNREKNDPEECCRFTYESYNKLAFFIQTDSLEKKIA